MSLVIIIENSFAIGWTKLGQTCFFACNIIEYMHRMQWVLVHMKYTKQQVVLMTMY